MENKSFFFARFFRTDDGNSLRTPKMVIFSLSFAAHIFRFFNFAAEQAAMMCVLLFSFVVAVMFSVVQRNHNSVTTTI